MSLGRAVPSPRDHILPPVGSMLPSVRLPLKHDLLGWFGRIQVKVAKELVAFADEQSGFGVFKILLAQAWGRAHHRFVAAENGMLRLRDEVPFPVRISITDGF